MAMRVSTSPVDGTIFYSLHQSDLNTFLTCPERARALWDGEVEDSTSAEAAIGTATHKAIELTLRGEYPSEALRAAYGDFRGQSEAAGFRWVKVKTEETALRHIDTCYMTWQREIQPLVTPYEVEHRFSVMLDWRHEPGEPAIEVWLDGIIDCVDANGFLWDWKTCSRLSKYTQEGWQLKRWGVQPTVYSYAADYLSVVEAPASFTWAAMCRTGGHALLTCERSPADWEWLKRLCWHVVEQDQADLTRWPVNDQHALCSADWCPAWSQCKGAFQALTLRG